MNEVACDILRKDAKIKGFTIVICLECGKVFKVANNKFYDNSEIECPRCGSIDVDLA